MKSYVSKNKFIDWFKSSNTYKNNFSYEGLNALFDWLEEYEDHFPCLSAFPFKSFRF
jgi:hypothetical protein